MRYKAAILAAIVTMAGVKADGGELIASTNIIETFSCRDIIDAGWANMPNIADYVHTKPGSDKLGYGSECAIGSLVFAQCWLEPGWSVEKAISVLIYKAATGKRLPKTPACGA